MAGDNVLKPLLHVVQLAHWNSVDVHRRPTKVLEDEHNVEVFEAKLAVKRESLATLQRRRLIKYFRRVKPSYLHTLQMHNLDLVQSDHQERRFRQVHQTFKGWL